MLTALKFPFAIKWAWAPLLDRFSLPFLGRRRGWMLVFQIGLLGGTCRVVAHRSRARVPADARDRAVDLDHVRVAGHRGRCLQRRRPDSVRADCGAAAYFVGYRTSMLVSGSLTLVMADHIVWNTVYAIMAALMLVGVVTVVFLAEEPAEAVRPPRTIMQSVYVAVPRARPPLSLARDRGRCCSARRSSSASSSHNPLANRSIATSALRRPRSACCPRRSDSPRSRSEGSSAERSSRGLALRKMLVTFGCLARGRSHRLHRDLDRRPQPRGLRE